MNMTAHDVTNPQDVPDYEAYLWHLREPVLDEVVSDEPFEIADEDNGLYMTEADWPTHDEWNEYLDNRDRYL